MSETKCYRGLLSFSLVCCLMAVVWPAFRQTSQAETMAVETRSQPDQWTITYNGKPVLVYAFDPQKPKPYVKQLYTLAGDGVLRDSPGDHAHHHALMYAVRVNGLNFWEEQPGCGVQKVIESPAPTIEKTPAGLQARIRQVLHWVSPTNAFYPATVASALLVETRTLTLTVDPDQRETALRWESEFEPGPGQATVTLTGANYHGLGMRFLKELDPYGTHFTPEGNPDLANNRQDVAAHRWEAVAFRDPERPATIALFGLPGNARGDPRFFAMKTPFNYLSATQSLHEAPLVYKRGERFRVAYLVTLYPEVKSAEALNRRAAEIQ